MQRPTAITVIAILQLIGGILALLGGIALIGLGGLATTSTMMGTDADVAAGGMLAAISGVMGFVLIALGVLDLVGAYGAWNLKKWAYMYLMVLNGISGALSLVSFNIIGIAISGVVLYFVYQNKASFTN